MKFHLSQIKFFPLTRAFFEGINEDYMEVGEQRFRNYNPASLSNLKERYHWVEEAVLVWDKNSSSFIFSEYRPLSFAEKAEKWFSIILLVFPCIVELLFDLAVDIIKGALDIMKAAVLDIFDMAIFCVAKPIKALAWTMDTLVLSPISFILNKFRFSEKSDNAYPERESNPEYSDNQIEEEAPQKTILPFPNDGQDKAASEQAEVSPAAISIAPDNESKPTNTRENGSGLQK